MAVVLGIYQQLLNAITSLGREALVRLFRFDLRGLFALVHWRFLLSLATGLGIGIVLMVKVVKLPTMVVKDSPHRELVYAIFFGMVLGSAFALGRHIRNWDPLRVAAVVLGAAVGYGIVTLVPTSTPNHPLFIFGCGAVAICAMLLPGISGSFILLILRKYAYILKAVAALDFMVILPFIAGCLVGILSFSRLLKWLLSRWQKTTYAVLVGLLIGSLRRIWPYQHIVEIEVREKLRPLSATPYLPDAFNVKYFVGFLVGLGFVVGIEWYASRRGRRDSDKDNAVTNANATSDS